MHHCDSWRIRDQIDVNCYYVLFHFFYAQHVSDIDASIIRILWLSYCIATLVVCSCFEVLHPATRIPLRNSHTETPTHIETRTHGQCGDTIETSQAPDDGCINVRNMLSIEEVKWNIITSDIKMVSFSSTTLRSVLGLCIKHYYSVTFASCGYLFSSLFLFILW